MMQAPSAVAAPKTVAELKALTARRDELNEQLEQLTRRRGQLANALTEHRAQERVGDVGPAEPLVAGIRDVDARTSALENEKLQVDKVILDARSRGLDEAHTGIAAQLTRGSSQPLGNTAQFQPQLDSDQLRQLAGRAAAPSALALVLFGIAVWQVAARATARRIRRSLPLGENAADIKQAVEAIAVEVERISEHQRYVTKLITEREGVRAESALGAPPVPDREP